MNTYRFRIYYEWHGPSHSDPLSGEKTQGEVYRALSHLPSEFSHRLPDSAASVAHTDVGETSREMTLSVRTTASREQALGAMEVPLKKWHLVGQILPDGSAA
jgi:hypothetical protein